MMRTPYAELGETRERVAQGIEQEESQFFDLINAGMPRVERLLEQAGGTSGKTVPGREAFDLLGTHGFPPELTATLAEEQGLHFDWDGFHEARRQHEQASGAGQRTELFKQGPLEELKKTLDGSEYLGYEADSIDDATVVGLISGEQTWRPTRSTMPRSSA
jgi:alanyl-tRNA synthetase